MVAFNYDFSNTPPSSGGGGQFPPSPQGGWLCRIIGEESKPMKQGQGTRHIFILEGMEGQVTGLKHSSGHNVMHPNPETTRIAMQEIAAIGWATGVLQHGQTFLTDTSQLFGKPFRVVVVQGSDPRYTEITQFLTADGKNPADLFAGKTGAPSAGPANNAPQGHPPQNFGGGGGFNGQPPQGAPSGQPNYGQQPQGGGWGGAPAGGPGWGQPQG